MKQETRYAISNAIILIGVAILLLLATPWVMKVVFQYFEWVFK